MWNLEVSDLDLQEEFKAEYGLSTDALFVDSEVNKIMASSLTAFPQQKVLSGFRRVG
jgi:hypothetical protein